MSPQRIKLSRAQGWRLPDNAVNCARPGPWGNPWIAGKPGHVIVAPGYKVRLPMQLTRRGAVDRYQRWLLGEFGDGAVIGAKRDDHPLYGLVLVPPGYAKVRARIRELRGRDLACWCPLDGGPCHTQVLMELANQ